MEDTKRCLYCYLELEKDSTSDYHPKCSKQFFGSTIPPVLSISGPELEEMALAIIKRSVTIPGVQPKLSLNIEPNPNDPKKSRLTVVGLWSNYILKPQSPSYKSLPENEDLTMKLAELAGIATAEHSLIRTSSGKLAYITKRFDRLKSRKVLVEDLCQLSELPSSGKYDSSMEKTGKTVSKYSSAPGFDVISFFEIALFSFVTGNADMHLKNFSIIKNEENQYRLSPAYDLLSTALALPADKEQMALTLNGKKNRINKKDFNLFAEKLKIDGSTSDKIIAKQLNLSAEFESLVNISFLSNEMKEQYVNLIRDRIKSLKDKS